MPDKSTITKLLRTTLIVVAAVPLVVGFVFVARTMQSQDAQRLEHTRSVAKILVHTYDHIAPAERQAWLNQSLTMAATNNDLAAIEIVDGRDRTVLRSGSAAGVTDADGTIVEARNSSGDLARILIAPRTPWPAWIRGLGLTLLLSAMGVAAYLAATQKRTQALRKSVAGLLRAVTSFRQLNFRARVLEAGDDEFGGLEHAVNSMAESLEENLRENRELVSTATKDLQATLEEVEIKNVELDLARRRAQDETRAKSEFLANMSHEIRTPMNSIVGYSQLLSQTSLGESQRGYVGNITQSATALLEIIEDILHLSRMEAGKLIIASREFDIRQIVRQSAAMVAPSAYQKELALRTFVAPDVPLCLFGDPLRIRQIITNLLSNAVKYTARGSISLAVACMPQAGRNVTLQMSVADTGRGITREDRARLFEPFTAASREERAGGAGLGLTIARSLTRAMGGQLSLESTPGSGSTFAVRLPLKADLTELSPFLEPLRGRRILCALADKPTRAHLLECFAFAGIDVVTRTDWRDVAALAAQQGIDAEAVVLDVAAGDFDQFCAQPAATMPGVAIAPSADSGKLCRIAATVNGHALPSYVSGTDILAAVASLLGIDVQDYPQADSPVRAADIAGQHVLIADDDRLGRTYLAELLANHNVRVTACADGQQAIDLANEVTFDAVFMDARMPVCDGVEATRQIRRHSKNVSTPIVALTASALPAERERYRAAGMNECLVKPARTADIIGILSKLPSAGRASTGLATADGADPSQPIAHLDDEMLRLLSAELPLYLARVKALREDYDEPSLREASHKLHGTAAVCRLDELRECAADIERMLRDGDGDSARARLDDLHGNIASVMEVVRRAADGKDASTQQRA